MRFVNIYFFRQRKEWASFFLSITAIYWPVSNISINSKDSLGIYNEVISTEKGEIILVNLINFFATINNLQLR
jgi:hypothetical protein